MSGGHRGVIRHMIGVWCVYVTRVGISQGYHCVMGGVTVKLWDCVIGG